MVITLLCHTITHYRKHKFLPLYTKSSVTLTETLKLRIFQLPKGTNCRRLHNINYWWAVFTPTQQNQKTYDKQDSYINVFSLPLISTGHISETLCMPPVNFTTFINKILWLLMVYSMPNAISHLDSKSY
jgi:hypothetical protein